MKLKGQLERLYEDALKVPYDPEKETVVAFSRIISAASSDLEATNAQISRLEAILESIAEEFDGGVCLAVMDQMERLTGQRETSAVLDAGIAAVAQDVEHYGIACYKSACALAEMLGQEDAFDLLHQTRAAEEETESRRNGDKAVEQRESGKNHCRRIDRRLSNRARRPVKM